MSNIQLADCQHVIEASDANLGESQFNDVRLAGSTFRHVTMEGSVFDSVHLDTCTFDKASFGGVAITDSNYIAMTIDGIEVEAMLALWRSTQAAAAAK